MSPGGVLSASDLFPALRCLLLLWPFTAMKWFSPFAACSRNLRSQLSTHILGHFEVTASPSTLYNILWFIYLVLRLSLAGKSGFLTWVRLQQPLERRYPFLTARGIFSCVQTKILLPMLWPFNVRTDVNTCDCTRRLYGQRKRVCTES